MKMNDSHVIKRIYIHKAYILAYYWTPLVLYGRAPPLGANVFFVFLFLILN